ncbi:MAG: glycosyltransferase family 4 protein [Thermoanaerobaculia bacterium]|nr:glycosyltransferase family 4 protein [Thermoanaerobaculia bacterium]
MRIFQVLEKNRFDTGSVQQMFQAASGLAARGHDVTIVSQPYKPMEERCAERGIRFRAVPLRHQFDIPSVFTLKKLLAELAPDVVHVHKGVSHAIALAAVAGTGVGAFVVNRGVSFPLDVWNRLKYMPRRVDRVVTVCEHVREIVIRSGRLPRQKVDVVYAGTDVALFDPAKYDRAGFRREKQIGDDQFLVAHVGIRDWKGWKESIDAVAEISAQHPHVHLIVIGCKRESASREVREHAALRGIAGHVTPVEYRTDMPRVFAATDLVIDTSWAGTGITGTVREAMAMEKPVIATDSGGNGELVSSREVGWLIPMRDHETLTAAMREVIENRALAKATGERAREHVMNHFSMEQRITKLEEVYESILARRRRSSPSSAALLPG